MAAEKKSSATDTLNVTFNEIYSDEPHEEISAKKTELYNRPLATHSGPQKKNSGVFDVGRAFAGNHVETGTIVIDKKRSRPTLMQNIGAAFSEWWSKTQSTVLEKQTEEKKVPVPPKEKAAVPTPTLIAQPVELPKEEARVFTIPNIPKKETPISLEKIRTYKLDIARLEHVVPTKNSSVVPVPKPTASKLVKESIASTTRDVQEHIQTADVRQNLIAPEVFERAKKKVPDLITTQEVVPPPTLERGPTWKYTTENIQDIVEKKPKPLVERSSIEMPTLISEETPLRKTEVPILPNENRAIYVPVSPEEVTIATPDISVKQPVEAVYSSERNPTASLTVLGTPPAFHENVPITIPKPEVEKHMSSQGSHRTFRLFLRFAILSLIGLCGIILAVVAHTVVTKDETTVPVEQVLSIPSFFNTDAQIQIPLTNGDAFFEDFSTAVAGAPSGLVQLYPTINGTIEGQKTIPNTEDFFAKVNARMPKNLLRGFEDTFMLGSITTTKNEPFMVVRSYNFDILFTGFFAWEPYMQTDFAPLFGAPDATRTRFSDAVRNNTSIRILYDANGKELLLYSFINTNTVIITTTGEALAKILERI
jgi:hypothetical protein